MSVLSFCVLWKENCCFIIFLLTIQDSSDDDDAAAAATHSEDSDVDVVGGGFGREPDMDSVLDSAGTTTRAEAILMIVSHS